MKHTITLLSLVLAMAMLLASCSPAASPAPTQAPAAPTATQLPTPTPTAAPTSTPSPEIPNPAAKYCVDQGFKNEIHTAADRSQAGVCKFPDGSECDEWAYFHGKCSPGKPTTSTGGTDHSKVGKELANAFNGAYKGKKVTMVGPFTDPNAVDEDTPLKEIGASWPKK